MSDIDHKAEAVGYSNLAYDNRNNGTYQGYADLGQLHATLYLAEKQAAAVEQQRVANLLSAANLILVNRGLKYGVLGVADWATDSDADIHEALASSSVWIALLGYDEAKRKGMTA